MSHRLLPLLGAGGAIGRPNENTGKCCQTLDQELEERLAALKESRSNFRVTSKNYITVGGLLALDSTIQFKDLRTGTTLLERTVSIHTKGDEYSFSVGIRCFSTDVSAFMPIFEGMVRSFRILGPPT